MLSQTLENLGLTDKEANAYLVLLKHGTQSTSFVAKKAGLNRGTSYLALHSLLEMGLITKSEKRNIQFFTALSPQSLERVLDRKEQLLNKQRADLGEVMENLLAIVGSHSSRPRIRFFQGKEGARSAFEETLFSKEMLLRAFLTIYDIAEFLGEEWFEDYTKRRIQTGYTLHAIRSQSRDNLAYEKFKTTRQWTTSQEQSREIRLVGDNLSFPITMYLFDNKLLIVSSVKENFATIIESNELAEMQKRLFEVIWATATKQ